MIKLAAVNLGYLDIADILTVSIRYRSDLRDLLKILRSNSKDTLTLQFRENGCLKDPTVKTERQSAWVEAFVKVVEVEPRKWTSKGMFSILYTN